MLKIAKPFEAALTAKLMDICFVEKYKYYHASNYVSYDIQLDNDSWNKIEMVSVDKNNEILGFFVATINRTAHTISNISAINFGEKNLTFSRDFRQFIENLFVVHKFRKIVFEVLVGNPAENMYDKYCERYGGRIIGTLKEEVLLYDGTYCDLKKYEIMKTDFDKIIQEINKEDSLYAS